MYSVFNKSRFFSLPSSSPSSDAFFFLILSENINIIENCMHLASMTKQMHRWHWPICFDIWITIRLRNTLIVTQHNSAREMNCYDDFSAKQWKSNCGCDDATSGVTKNLGQWISRSEHTPPPQPHPQPQPQPPTPTPTPTPDKMAALLADENFKCIFVNGNDRILIRISLKFVPRSPINNNPALVQVMAWHRTGDRPLS